MKTALVEIGSIVERRWFGVSTILNERDFNAHVMGQMPMDARIDMPAGPIRATALVKELRFRFKHANMTTIVSISGEDGDVNYLATWLHYATRNKRDTIVLERVIRS